MQILRASKQWFVALLSIVSFAILAPQAKAAAPTITELIPASVHAGWPAFTLTVEGKNFVAGSKVYWGKYVLSTKFDSATLLSASVPASLITSKGIPLVTVSNPDAKSAGKPLTIEAQKPLITGVIPSSMAPGGPAFTLTINGADFVKNETTVDWKNTSTGAVTKLTITALTASELRVTVPEKLIATAGTASVTVATAGGTSAAQTYAVTPTPSISALTPKSASVGWPAFTLTVAGKGFVTTSKVLWGAASTKLSTKYVSATQLTASVPATLLTKAGTAAVIVSNGTVKSKAATFTINAAKPEITNLSPAAIAPGHTANFTLIINGADFVVGKTKVSWKSATGGAATTLSLVSMTTKAIKVTVPKTLVAKAGSATITVTVTPGGTATAPFTIAAAPTLTKLSAVTAIAGDPNLPITLTGANFIKGAAVVWKTPAKTTTITPGSFTATAITLSAAVVNAQKLLVNTGKTNIVASVTVTTPAGSSKALKFTIAPVKPVITTVSPTSATAGGAAFTLTVNGYNFATGAQVFFKGVGLKTTLKSSTQLTAAVPVKSIAAAGTVSVTVVSNKVTSSAVSFVIKPPTKAKVTITSLSKTTAVSGASSAFPLTIVGTGFVNKSTIVNWAFPGNPVASLRPTAYSGTTQLTVQVTPDLLVKPGTATISVTTAAGTSAGVKFIITQALPAISGLDPSSVTAGQQTTPLVMTITGTNFIAGATAHWTPATGTATALATTVVNSTLLHATVPANLLVAVGSAKVTVVTSAGTSSPAGFSINPASGPACANDGSGNSMLNGIYSFEFTQVDLTNNGVSTRNVGTFTADGNGGITAGIKDSNGAHLTSAALNTAFTGTYSVGGDDRGLLTINYTGGATTYFCFALDSLTSNVAGSARLISDPTETLLVSSGSFYAQGSSSIAPSTVGGSWAMGIDGVKLDASNGNETRGATAGYITLDGTNKVTAGEADISQDLYSSGKLANSSTAKASITGSYTLASTGRGTMTLTYATVGTSHYVFYVAGANQILLLSTDTGGKGGSAVLSGRALERPSSISFANGTLNGNSVFIDRALTNTTSTQYDHRLVQAGIFDWNGAGSYTKNYDQNDAGVIAANQTASSTYAVDSAGRVAISGTTPAISGYLVDANEGFAVSGNLGVSALYFEGQATGGFNLASFSGNYSEGTLGYENELQKVSSGEVDADGAGNLTGNLDVAPGLGGQVDSIPKRGFGVKPDWSRPKPREVTLDETYTTSTVPSRFVVKNGTATVQALYLVSPDKAYAIDIVNGDNWQPLEVFNHQ